MSKVDGTRPSKNEKILNFAKALNNNESNESKRSIFLNLDTDQSGNITQKEIMTDLNV